MIYTMTFNYTPELPPEDFNDYVEELRSELNATSRFDLTLPNSKASIRFFVMNGAYQGVSLVQSGEETMYQHGPHDITTFYDHVTNYGLPAPQKQRAPGIADSLTIDSAAEVIAAADNGLVFYTGAGISHAGKRPVMHHQELEKRLGFVDEDSESGATNAKQTNADFVKTFTAAAGKRQEVAETYTHFLESIFEDASTPAHVSIAGIIKHFGRRPRLLTSNFDCKHEAMPSSLQAVKIPAGWWHPEKSTNKGTQAREVVEQLGRQPLRLLVTCGVGDDTRGVLRYLKQAQPDLKLLAVSQNQPESIPYLGQADYCVTGDAQQVLPAIADMIRR